MEAKAGHVNKNKEGVLRMIKYVVWQKYFDNGKVQAGIQEMEADQVPENKELPKYDLYYDAFDDRGAAEKFKAEALKA